MIEYVGLFIDEDGIKDLKNNEKCRLVKLPKSFHLTLEYKPKNLDSYKNILGKSFKIKVVGYGSGSKNSGYLVELPDELLYYYKNTDKNGEIKPAHITMSLSNDGHAVDTAFLNFQQIDPFYVSGKIDYIEIKGNVYEK